MNIINWFRHSSAYIYAHRNKTFVLLIDGDALEHSNFSDVVNDIAVLNSLGIRLVLIHSARSQINALLKTRSITSKFHNNHRVTQFSDLEIIQQAVGASRCKIEALLSKGFSIPFSDKKNGSQHTARMQIVSGNFISAKPAGIWDGIDMGFTGRVRSIDCREIEQHLDNHAIVLLSPLGYSPSGECFNISSEEIAAQCTRALSADKLIYMGADEGILNSEHKLVKNLTAEEAKSNPPRNLNDQLSTMLSIFKDGSPRLHIISYKNDGSLLQELFTHEGSGTLISKSDYLIIREADLDDISDILKIIEPLEEKGILTLRSQEHIENEIDDFIVIEFDDMIVACGAIHRLDKHSYELACLAVHNNYQKQNHGNTLIQYIIEKVKLKSAKALYVFTTHTSHWFQERGFTTCDLSELPKERQSLYQTERNSKVLKLPLL